MSTLNSFPESRLKRWVDCVIILLLFLGGVFAGKAYLNAIKTDQSAILGTELLYGPSVMLATGRGFYQPDTGVSPELRAFLRNEVETLNPEVLPEEIPEAPSSVAAYHRYLLYTVAFFWRVFGISWSSLELLVALMLGWCAAAAYGLFRLGMGRIISTVLALVFMLSPPILIMLPHLRDFSKAPFILTTIFLLLYFVKAKPVLSRLRLLLPLLGLVIGIGMGFRQDIIIFIPPAIVVACIALFRGDGGTWPRRAGVLFLFLVCLFGTAWPMLGRMEGGAQPYHPLVQGYSMKRMESLGIAPAAYAPLASGHDNYVFAMLYDYNRRVNNEADAHFEYNSPGAEAAGRQWLLDMGIHFPADVLTRGYASVLRSLRYADAYIPWFALFPPALRTLENIHLDFARFMHRFGLVLGLMVLLLLGSQNVFAGLGLIVFVVYVFGYVGLQCEFRHAFHLSFVPFWLVGFLISVACRRVTPSSLKIVTRKQVLHALGKGLVFSCCALILVVFPLYAMRLYQHYMAAPLFEGIVSASCETVTIHETQKHGWALFSIDANEYSADAAHHNNDEKSPLGRLFDRLKGALKYNETEQLPLWDTRAQYMVAEFDAEVVPEWLCVRYTSVGARNDFSQMIRLPSVQKKQGTIRYYFPVYELLMPDDEVVARHSFVGIGLPAKQAQALKGLYEVTDLSNIHFLIQLMTTTTGLSLPHYQRIDFAPDPLLYYLAENDPIGVATQAESAVRMGRKREAIFLCRTAILLSGITSHRLHMARTLAKLGDLDAALEGALDERNWATSSALETADLLFDIGVRYRDRGNFSLMESALTQAAAMLEAAADQPATETLEKFEEISNLRDRISFVYGEAVIRHIALAPDKIHPEEVVKNISHAVKLSPELAYLAAETLEKAGGFYMKKGQHEYTRMLYDAAARLAPETHFAAVRAAEALAAGGNMKGAKEQLIALLQKEPCDSAAAALQRILLEHSTKEERLEFWSGQATPENAPLCVVFYHGCALADTGRYEEAAAIFNALQKEQYDMAELELRRRIVLLATSREEKETAFHQYVKQNHPEQITLAIQLLLDTAETLNVQNHPLNAEAVARIALELSPEAEIGWLALGEALAAQGRQEDALAVFVKAFDSASSCKLIALRLDSLFEAAGDQQQRHETWRSLAGQHPENDVVLLHWGMAAEAMSAYEEARNAYVGALEHGPGSGVVSLRLGGVLACLGETETGSAMIAQAVSSEPSLQDLAAYTCQNAGNHLLEKGALEQALLFFGLAAGYAPHDPFPWLKTGEVHQLQGNAPDAIEAYRKVIGIDAASDPALEAARRIDALLDSPDRAAFWAGVVAEIPEALLPALRHGFALTGTDITLASGIATALTQQHPENAEVELLQGIVWCGTGQVDAGLGLVRKTTAANPHLASEAAAYLATVAKTLMESENPVSALTVLQGAASLDPENMTYAFLLGEALLAGNENRAAVEQFRKVLLKAPESPRSAQLLEEACVRLNMPDLCHKIWQEIAEAHPLATLPKERLQSR
jgi:tetratricopeptide (TPR) repeat protein